MSAIAASSSGTGPAFDARDASVKREIAHDDLVTEWPQSGERIVGEVNCLVVLRRPAVQGMVRECTTSLQIRHSVRIDVARLGPYR